MSISKDKGLINPLDSKSFSDVLGNAFRSVDSSGRLNAEAARELFLTMKNMPKEIEFSIALEPEKYLGAFELLPLDVRNAIVQAIASEDRWCMAGYEIGGWPPKMAQLLWKLKWKLSKYKFEILSKLAEIFAIVLQGGPARLLHVMYQQQNRWRGKFSARPTLQSVMDIMGIQPRDFAVCYAQNIPQPEAYRGFWHDPSLHNTYGVVIGIDLIPTPEGCWYVESNLNVGLKSARSDLYERDPFVSNIIKFTEKHGYRHLMIVHNTSSHLDKAMAMQYEEETMARGIKLTIVEDIYLPKSKYIQSFCIPSLDEKGTLVVRTKFYHTALDYLFDNKKAVQRALEIYKELTSDTSLLLPITKPEPVIEKIEESGPFPNLVFKFPDKDIGKGVYFLKATSPEHAHMILKEAIKLNHPRAFMDLLHSLIEERNGLFQIYIRPSLLKGKTLYKVRSYVLITPVGIQFLSAHRFISDFMVPDSLPFGVVKDPRPYLVNSTTSSLLEIVPPEEELSVVSASLAIAKGLSWAATYGFQTSP